MSGISSVGGAQPINMISLEGLDLESMIMAVQTNRVNVLDEQIKSKMEVVQARNVRINELNANMSGMNAAIQRIGGDGAATNELTGTALTDFLAAAPQVQDEERISARASHVTSSDNVANKSEIQTSKDVENLLTTMKQTGYVASAEFLALPRSYTAATGMPLTQSQNDTLKSEAAAVAAWLKSDVPMKADPEAAKVKTRGQAEAYVKSIQTQIDSLGNTQQMDMLNLQSLSNKRNEAFEIMTNFMKKFNDSRAGIIQKF